MTPGVPSFPVVEAPPSKPWILRIPNEILLHILSYLTNPPHEPNRFVTYDVEDGEIQEVSQILVLRSVCSLFRTATAELDFWCDPEFTFMDLLYPHGTHSVHRMLDKEEQFLRVIFSDDHLVESLSRRKTDWKFDSVGGLDVVMESIPLFTQNTRAISLEFVYGNEDESPLESQFDIAFERLAVCSGVTKLNTNLAFNVDLSAAAASFPLLEELDFCQTSMYTGSSRGFTRLRKMGLDSWHCPPMMGLWLPVNSTETLTELRLHCGGLDRPVFDTTILEKFTNLKTLSIQPLCKSVCNYIINSPMQLDVFETNLQKRLVPINKFGEMLHAESLRNLKEFELTNHFEDPRTTPGLEQYYLSVFDMFTSILCSVEEVQLSMPLHLRCCQYFARMKNLKILNWDGTWPQSFGCSRGKDPKLEVKKALDAAFANFVVKPEFAVHFMFG
jgi:hypothetical protein